MISEYDPILGITFASGYEVEFIAFAVTLKTLCDIMGRISSEGMKSPEMKNENFLVPSTTGLIHCIDEYIHIINNRISFRLFIS